MKNARFRSTGRMWVATDGSIVLSDSMEIFLI